MSSIIKKTSSRFTPRITERKQSQTTTPGGSKAGTPGVQKTVHIDDHADIIPDRVEQEDEPQHGVPLNKNIFHTDQTAEEEAAHDTAAVDEAVIDDDDDPKRKSSTVIINPTKLTHKERRTSSTVGAPNAFRRSSITDGNRRMRRLSSITSGLSSGLGFLRRPSIPSSSGGVSQSPAPHEPGAAHAATAGNAAAAAAAAESSGPIKISIPTATQAKTAKAKSGKSAAPKAPRKRRSAAPAAATREPSEAARDETVEPVDPAGAPVEAEDAAQIAPEVVQLVTPVQGTAKEAAALGPTDYAEMVVGQRGKSGSARRSGLSDPDDESEFSSGSDAEAGPDGRVLDMHQYAAARRTRHAQKRTLFSVTARDRAPADDQAPRKRSRPKSNPPPRVTKPENEEVPVDYKGYRAIIEDNKRIRIVPEGYGVEAVIDSLDDIPKRLLTGDHQLFSGFKINEKTMTMAELCSNVFPMGEVSENFELAKLAAQRKRELAARRSEFRKKARAERVSYDSIVEAHEEQERENRRREAMSKTGDAREAQMKPTLKNKRANVQLSVGENSQIIVEAESVLIDRHADAGEDYREKITENAFESAATSSTYSKRMVTDRWDAAEVKLFYEALSMWGTDFNIITQMFPHRNRRQIKLKFNAEERKHPYIVELALKSKLPVDFGQYCERTKKEFKTLEEYNQELRELKEAHDKHVREIKEAKEKQRLEDIEQQRIREVEARTGVKSLSRAQRAAALRQNESVIGEIPAKTEA